MRLLRRETDLKKVISAFIAAVIFVCTPVMSFVASASSNYVDTIEFLNALNITDKSEKNINDKVSRGEFLEMVIKALDLGKTSQSEKFFEDVDGSSPFYDVVSEAVNMGIISGDGNGKFLPDGNLSFAAAVKITVCALGYKDVAASYGGYPAGYLAISSEIDLLRGINKTASDYMILADCSELIYNFLNADLCLAVGMDGKYPIYERNEGKCILSQYRGLNKNEGIITGAGFAALESGIERDGSLTINGKKFKFDKPNAEKYVGLAAVCWADENDNIELIYVKPKNKTVRIEADDIKEYSNNTLHTFDKNYKLDIPFSVSKNGMYTFADDSIFKISNGYITLIDNSGDGKYDAVIIFEAKYMTVSGINENKSEVYDTKNGVLKLKNDGDFHSTIKIKNKDGSFKNISFKDIPESAVFMYYTSEDGVYTLAEGCTDAVSGKVTEILENTVFVDGTEYKINDNFKKNYNLTPGFEGTFRLACDGTITSVSDAQTSDMKYGYFTGYKSEDNIAQTVKISIFTTNGNFIYPELEDNVVFDGVRMPRKSEEIKNSLLKNGAPNYGVIRYGMSIDGKINIIDTAEEVDSALQPHEKYGKSFVGDNVLTRYAKKVKSFYYPTLEQFVPYAIIDAAVIFGVPYEISSGDGGVSYDENMFSILNSGNLANSKTYEIDTYDVSYSMRPVIVVVYDKNAGVSLDVGKSEDAAVVINVSNTVSENGEVLKTLYMWKNGNYIKYRITSETDKLLSENGVVLKSGDIIRFALNGENEITRIVKDAAYNTAAKKPEIIEGALEGHQVDCAEYAGTVLYHNGNSLTLKLDSISAYSENYGTAVADQIIPLSIKTTTSVAIYDAEKNTVTQGDVDDLRDGYSVGEENGSYVFIKGYSGGINQMIIYR